MRRAAGGGSRLHVAACLVEPSSGVHATLNTVQLDPGRASSTYAVDRVFTGEWTTAKVHASFLRSRLPRPGPRSSDEEAPEASTWRAETNRPDRDSCVGGLVFLASTPAAMESQRLQEGVQDTDGLVVGGLADMLSSGRGRTFLSVVHVNGAGVHDLLGRSGSEQSVPTGHPFSSDSAGAVVPEGATVRPMATTHDLMPALLVARNRLRELAGQWDSATASGCIVYTLAVAEDDTEELLGDRPNSLAHTRSAEAPPASAAMSYTYVDFGDGLSDGIEYMAAGVPFVGTLELLQDALVGCLERPAAAEEPVAAHPHEHPLLPLLRQLRCVQAQSPITVLCLCGVASPPALADTGLLLEQVVIQRIGGKLSQAVLAGALQSPLLQGTPAQTREPLRSARSNVAGDSGSGIGNVSGLSPVPRPVSPWQSPARFADPGAFIHPVSALHTDMLDASANISKSRDENDWGGTPVVGSRRIAPASASSVAKRPSHSLNASASYNETPAGSPSEMNRSAADSVDSLADMHHGNLLKRLSEELAKCNEELRSKENAYVELARCQAELKATRGIMEELQQENVWLRRRCNSYKLVVDRKDRIATMRTTFGALQHEAVRSRKVRKFVLKFLRRQFVQAFSGWKLATISRRGRVLLLRRSVLKLCKVQLWFVLNSWRDHVHKTRRRNYVKDRVLRRIKHMEKLQVFNSWRAFHRRQCRAKQILRRATARFTMQRQCEAFEVWHAPIAEKKRQLSIARRITKYLQNRRLAPAFVTWKAQRGAALAIRVKITRCIARMQRGNLCAALAGWAALAVEARRMTHLRLKAVKKLCNRVLSRAYDSWRENVRHIVAVQAMMLRTATRLANGCISSALAAWADMAHQARRRRRSMMQVSARLRHRQIAMAYLSWTLHVSEAKRMRVALVRSLARMSKQQLVHAYSAWAENTLRNKAAKSVWIRARAKMTLRSLSLSFSTWAKKCSHLRELRYLARQSLHRLVARQCGKSWNAWNAMVTDKHRLKKLQAQVIRKLCNRSIANACASWRQHVEFTKKCRRIATNAARRIGNRLMIVAWAGWLSIHAEKKQQRAKVQTAVQRLLRRELFTSFSTWAWRLSETKRRTALILRMLLKIVHNSSSKAFHGWSSATATCVRRKLVLQRALMRMIVKCKGDAFFGWASNVRNVTIQRRSLQKVVLRMRNKVLASFLDGWYQNCKAKIRNRAVAQRCVARIVMKMQSVAFSGWIYRVSEIRRKNLSVMRCLTKMIHSYQERAFCAWVAGLINKKRLQSVARRAAISILRTQLSMAFKGWKEAMCRRRTRRLQLVKCVKRLQNVKVGAALHGWKMSVEAVAAQRLIVKRTLVRMKNRCQGYAFDAWICQVQEIARVKRSLEAIVARLQNKATALAFDSWCDCHAIEQKHRRLVRRSIQKLQNQCVFAAYATWRAKHRAQKQFLARTLSILKSNADHAKIRKAKMTKVVLRVQKLILAAAYGAWVLFSKNLRHQKAILIRCVVRMRQRSVTKVMDAWVKLYCHRRLVAATISKCLNRMRHRDVAKAFEAWTFGLYNMQRMQNLLRKCVLRIKFLVQRVVLHHWWVSFERRQLVRKRAASALQGSLLYCFTKWSDLCAEIEADAQLQIAKYERFRGPKMLALHFREWVGYVDDVKAIMSRAVQQGFAGTLRGAFMQWVFGYQLRKHQQWLLQRAGRRFIDAKASLVLSRWAEHVYELHELKKKAEAALIALKMQLVRSAYRSWADMWVQALAAREALIQNTARRFVHQTEARVFGRWFEHWDTKKRLRYKAELMLGRSASTLIFDVFCGWVERVDARKDFMSKMRRAETYFRREIKKGLRSYFKTWFWTALGERAFKAAAGRKFLRRVSNIKLAIVVEEWQTRCREERTKRRKEILIGRSVTRLLYRQARAAFDSMVDFWNWRKELREKLRAKVRRHVQGVVEGSFERWSVWTRDQKQLRVLLARREKRLQREAVQGIFLALAVAAQEQKRMVQLLRRALAKMLQLALSAAFNGWLRTFKRRMIVRKRAASVLQGSVLYCFTKWSDLCAEIEADAQLQIAKYERFRGPKMLALHFREWVGYVDDVKAIMSRAVQQ
eukprot:SAG31_NODE_1827_length_7166_cov_23.699731_3_plen_2083_part_01